MYSTFYCVSISKNRRRLGCKKNLKGKNWNVLFSWMYWEWVREGIYCVTASCRISLLVWEGFIIIPPSTFQTIMTWKNHKFSMELLTCHRFRCLLQRAEDLESMYTNRHFACCTFSFHRPISASVVVLPTIRPVKIHGSLAPIYGQSALQQRIS